MHGPQGIGALIMRKKRYRLPPVKPIMFGGGQEHGLRPGTLPTALIVGFGEACVIAEREATQNNAKCREIKKQLLELLEKSGVRYEINGDQEYCVPTTLNLKFIHENFGDMRKQKDFYGVKPRTSSAASEKRTSTSTSRPTSAGAKPYTQVKETAPKASKPQSPVNTPAQPDPRMPLLKKRALLISELESATGLFNIFKRMRLKREIRAVEDKLNDYS